MDSFPNADGEKHDYTKNLIYFDLHIMSHIVILIFLKSKDKETNTQMHNMNTGLQL